jgi:hypothetical protein
MTKCKTCRTNFTEKSKEDFQAAPGWNNECPACTKKKFEKYIGEYLLKLLHADGLVSLSKQYFGEPSVTDRNGDAEAKIVEDIAGLVYGRRGKQGIKSPATQGDAIATFVQYFDNELKQHAKPDARTKWTLLMLLLGSAGVIVLAVLLYILG